MKTLVLFYSYSGNTRAVADREAIEQEADIEEIIEVKKPNMLVGLYRASRRKKTAIQPIKATLDDYDKIIMMSPIWAAHPVSAFNSAIDCLPAGKKVELIMVSGGGGSKKSAEGTIALIKARGCEVTDYTDLKATRKDKVTTEVL